MKYNTVCMDGTTIRNYDRYEAATKGAGMRSYSEYENIINDMRAAGRLELIHYAGAAHRDAFAAELVEQWLKDKLATESMLRERTLDKIYK